MAAGDIKGPEVVVIESTLGATTTLGQVVALQADGKWDPVTDQSTGKFGVALDAGDDNDTAKIAIYGRVEVYASAAVEKGAVVMAAGTGTGHNTGRVLTTDNGAVGENIGTAMEAATADGDLITVWIGMVA